MRPILLDLFCGAGGCTKGYQEAGFCVIGVDIEPQPNYCGDDFAQDDALFWLRNADLSAFDAVHASPPCPRYSTITPNDAGRHPNQLQGGSRVLAAWFKEWELVQDRLITDEEKGSTQQ